MSQSAQPISVTGLLASLRDRTANGVYAIALDGGELPVSVHVQESPLLVFTFAGAVDRTTRTLPFFVATGLHTQLPASIIAFSDPSLVRNDEMRLAWYAGHEGFALQQQLPPLIDQIIDCLGAARIAFAGGSGGGFAALYYSWHVPGSVAVVTNPQTNLNHAIQTHRARYHDSCWPALSPNDPFDTVIEPNLGAIYAKRCDNSVIYLQEASDFLHLKWHFAPFVAALPREYGARLVVRMTHWGRRGHQAIPTYAWMPWVRAALFAPETTAVSLEETWAKESSQQTHTPPAPRAHAANRDQRIAADLARRATSTLLSSPSSERNV